VFEHGTNSHSLRPRDRSELATGADRARRRI
jgi:hypothetical protein